MRKRLFACAVVLLAMSILVFASLRVMGPSGRGISWAGYKAIRQNMNRHDVEAIMGRPPGEYRTFPLDVGMRAAEDEWGELGGEFLETWNADAGMIGVFFEGPNGTAQTVGAYFSEPLLAPEESIFQRFRRWFGF